MCNQHVLSAVHVLCGLGAITSGVFAIALWQHLFLIYSLAVGAGVLFILAGIMMIRANDEKHFSIGEVAIALCLNIFSIPVCAMMLCYHVPILCYSIAIVTDSQKQLQHVNFDKMYNNLESREPMFAVLAIDLLILSLAVLNLLNSTMCAFIMRNLLYEKEGDMLLRSRFIGPALQRYNNVSIGTKDISPPRPFLPRPQVNYDSIDVNRTMRTPEQYGTVTRIQDCGHYCLQCEAPQQSNYHHKDRQRNASKTFLKSLNREIQQMKY